MAETNEKPKSLADFARDMKRDWDYRARENAKWFINTLKRDQSDEEFYASGKLDVEGIVLNDPIFTRGRDLKSLRLLEIGCGIGRMTGHLAQVFGEVHAVDVSTEMINQARVRFRDVSNISFYETSGLDFSALPDNYFDLIFSVLVFQHMPDVTVIRSNIRDACRVLKQGGLFKFQVCGIDHDSYAGVPKDSWTGAAFTEGEIRRAARENGVKLVSIFGHGTQYCWVILRKPLPQTSLRMVRQPKIELFGRSDDLEIKEIPTNGDYAYLTVVVSGIDQNEVDANSVILEINGQDYLPIYAGWFGGYQSGVIGGDVDRLIQVNLGVTAKMARGRASVRVKYLSGEKSDPVTIDFLDPQPIIPKITLINNEVDDGVDVHARGEKSVFRVFASGLDDTATPDNVRIHVNQQILKPVAISFIPVNGVHMAVARMPEGITAGEAEIKLQFADGVSPPAKTYIIG